MMALKSEINPSDNYRKTTIQLLVQVSRSLAKTFHDATRDDILAFLDTLRKPESLDPMHKWVGTYNLYNVQLTQFFRWLFRKPA